MQETETVKPLHLLLTTTLLALCIGCGPGAGVKLPDEELEEEEQAVPATPPPPKSMVHTHKSQLEHDGKPLDYWVAESKSESVETRLAAVHALGNMGPAAVPALNELLRDKDFGVQLAAAEALKKIRQEKR
jgi:hypothetical protein